ncbi:MAG: hypothetical protein ABEJ66_02735 [Candidatus Nanohaloarchaea archaeon]
MNMKSELYQDVADERLESLREDISRRQVELQEASISTGEV